MADLKNYNGENIENLLLATTTSPGLIASEDKVKVDTIKAIAKIAVGDTVIEASDITDEIKFENGSNVTLNPDPDNKKIKIAATNTTYDLNATKSATNGNVKLNLVPNSGTTDTVTIKGSGATSVTTDASGVVTVSSTNTTYSNMTAATASAAGKAGLVPAPAAGKQGQYLRGDGTWATPTNTTYSGATQSAAGLMTAADKTKLDGIAAGANNYTHPSSHAASMITQDATHRFVSDTEKSTWNSKAAGNHTHDLNTLINALSTGSSTPTDNDYYVSQYAGGGNTTTTYHRRPVSALWSYMKGKADSVYQPKGAYASTAVATTSANGLMSSTDKSKLDGIATGANKYTHPGYTARNAGLYKITVDATGHVSAVSAVAKADITALGIPGSNTTYSAMKGATADADGAAGLVPVPAKGAATRYLRSDGTWQVPPNTDTKYSAMTGATANAAGSSGLVPTPAAGKQGQYLRGDGTWQTPTNTTYSDATTSAHGLMTAAMVTKLNGIATGANAYTHPAYTAKSSGLYKITVDATGHVSATTAVAKADITALGIPASDTNTWRGVQNNLTSDAADQSLSAAQGKALKALVDGKAASSHSHTNLDQIGSVGYYGSDAANSNGWYKVYTGTLTGYSDAVARLSFESGYAVMNYGVLHVHIRCDNGALTVKLLSWETRKGFAAGDVIIVTSGNTWTLYVQQTNTQYGRIKVRVLESMGTSSNWTMTLTSNTTKESTAPTATAKATDGATVNYANSAGSATNDSGGSNIRTTYIKGLSVSGRTITYTKGDGTTGTITTQDTNTTYSAATTSAAGLMSAADKSKLDGIASGANKYSHPTYTAKSSGLYKITVDGTGHVSATAAVAKADITALGIPAQDTTYSDLKGASTSAAGTHGLVPAPAKGAANRYLRSDGTWQVPPDNNTTYSNMGAATASAAGKAGLVPAPAAGKQTSFLRGDGTWVVPTNTTYGAATTYANGLMTSAMVTKLNGISTGANKVSITDDGAGNVTINIA